MDNILLDILFKEAVEFRLQLFGSWGMWDSLQKSGHSIYGIKERKEFHYIYSLPVLVAIYG